MDSPAPYVDALGNPLPPIRKLDDLPNIKEHPGRTVIGDAWSVEICGEEWSLGWNDGNVHIISYFIYVSYVFLIRQTCINHLL